MCRQPVDPRQQLVELGGEREADEAVAGGAEGGSRSDGDAARLDQVADERAGAGVAPSGSGTQR